METIKKGFCQCGCGEQTWIAGYNRKSLGWIKGKPIQFIRGHHSRVMKIERKMLAGNNHPQWKGGQTINYAGYKLIKKPDHPRAHPQTRYIREHILIAEKAIGRYLSEDTPIHHFPENPSNQLIICQDRIYHHLLHRRYRALKACGHANWLKCEFCHKWDEPTNLHIAPKKQSRAWHRQCSDDYRLRKRLLRKNAI